MRILGALGIALLAGACASQSYSDLPVGMQAVAVTGTIAVAVHDTRPYIVSSELASHTLKGTDALGFSQAGGETITKSTAAKLDELFADPRIVEALR